jgi:uncharacterized protein with NRDE domain
MCLIAFDYRPTLYNKSENTSCPTLLLVANRDEYYRRPSQRASFWKPLEQSLPQIALVDNNSDLLQNEGDDDDDEYNENRIESDLNKIDTIFGGKDLLQGGTWLGCSSNGRFATITNFRCDQDRGRQYPRSRGEIVSLFTASSSVWRTAREFVLDFLHDKLDEYAGFSVLLFDGTSLICCTNRGNLGDNEDKNGNYNPMSSWFRVLTPGLYGLSNHLLDTPWPRVLQAKKVVGAARECLLQGRGQYNGKLDEHIVNRLLEGFADTRILENKHPEDHVVSGDEIQLQRAMCVRIEGFGTRTTTVVVYDDATGYEFIEKNFETPYEQESYTRERIPLASQYSDMKRDIQGRQMQRTIFRHFNSFSF